MIENKENIFSRTSVTHPDNIFQLLNSQRDDTSDLNTSVENAYQAIANRIIRGIYAPGKHLAQRTLGTELNMSRIPVAEALVRLEQDGLVEGAPHRGARVRYLDERKFREEQAFRAAIEVESARLCAQYAPDSALAALEKQAIALDRIMGDPAVDYHDKASSHLSFHQNIAYAAGYPLLARSLRRSILIAIFTQKAELLPKEPIPDDWHSRLITDICTRDSELAAQTMRKHVYYITT